MPSALSTPPGEEAHSIMQKQGSLPDAFDWEADGDASSEGLPTGVSTSRGKIIGRHPSIRGVLATLDRVARSNCTVLVTGESGTGKELAVAALHDASLRSKKSLVAVNCGAIPENLIESELFGHARGAFTGAHVARQGWVAAAEGGTLFLDEVGERQPAVDIVLRDRDHQAQVGADHPILRGCVVVVDDAPAKGLLLLCIEKGDLIDLAQVEVKI